MSTIFTLIVVTVMALQISQAASTKPAKESAPKQAVDAQDYQQELNERQLLEFLLSKHFESKPYNSVYEDYEDEMNESDPRRIKRRYQRSGRRGRIGGTIVMGKRR